MSDLIELASSFPRENEEMHIPGGEIAKFKNYYSKLMYQAILTATKNSFNKMKSRLGCVLRSFSRLQTRYH